MRSTLIILFLISSNLAFGQFQKIINQSIEVENIERLEVNLAGHVSYQEWVGSFILIETKIIVKHGNERIFRSWMKEKRYLANIEKTGDLIRLYSHPDLGRIEVVNGKQVDENVFILIRFPKGLKDKDGQQLLNSVPGDGSEAAKEHK